MIRIDENTYIDDTLVTCAEYQLFIDEMREQGKYYQPDHWISYQFIRGLAREPILGVREDDGVEFCEWLTKRETDGWSYRLPRPYEAKQHFLKTYTNYPLGYWTNDGILWDFIWVNGSENQVRDLNLRIEDILDNYDDAHYSDIFSTIDQYQDEPLHFGSLNDKYINSVISSSFSRKLPRNLASDLIYYRDYINDFQEGHAEVDRDIAVKMYIDIYTLQERTAGRSPAFEGIRLVKERVK